MVCASRQRSEPTRNAACAAEKEVAVKNVWSLMQHLNCKRMKRQGNGTDDGGGADALGRKAFVTSNTQSRRPQELYESWPPNETDYARAEHPRDREDGWEWEVWRLW